MIETAVSIGGLGRCGASQGPVRIPKSPGTRARTAPRGLPCASR